MNQENVGAMTIVLLVKYFKPNMISLLKRNGIRVPDRASDNDIINYIVASLKASKTFRKDLQSFMSKPQVISTLFGQFKNFIEDHKFYGFTEEADYFKFTEEAQYYRMDGGYANATGFSYNAVNPTLNLTSQYGLDFSTPSSSTTNATTATTSETAPKTTSSFWTKAFDFVNKGVETFVTLDTNKTNRAIAESQTALAQTGGTLPQNFSNGNSSGGNGGNTGKSNTTMYILLGVLGIAVVGTAVYFYNKKQN